MGEIKYEVIHRTRERLLLLRREQRIIQNLRAGYGRMKRYPCDGCKPDPGGKKYTSGYFIERKLNGESTLNR